MSPLWRLSAALALVAPACLSSAALTGSSGGGAKRVTARKANTNGHVLIVMYHNFEPTESRYARSYSRFRKDLEAFYKLGLRPVTMSEYLSNTMSLPSGATPVVITMDDSSPTQFQINKAGDVDPHCAVGIWNEFAKSHPDFPVKGTFYVLPTVMWDQPGTVHTKVRMLKDWGSELACHTWSHPSLRHLSDAALRKQYGKSMDYLAQFGFDSPSLAFPYGIYPHNMQLATGFNWKGKTLHLTGAVTCNPDLAPSPTKVVDNAYRIPRIEARRGFLALDYWLPRLGSKSMNLYVQP